MLVLGAGGGLESQGLAGYSPEQVHGPVKPVHPSPVQSGTEVFCIASWVAGNGKDLGILTASIAEWTQEHKIYFF